MSRRTPQTPRQEPPGGGPPLPPAGGRMAPILTIVVVATVLILYFFNTTALSWLVPDLVATPEAVPATEEASAAATAMAAAAGTIAAPTVPAAAVEATGAAAAPAAPAPAEATEIPAQVDGVPTILFADLPVEAHETIALIDAGGPFPFDQDDSVFQNREGLLPSRPRGYYREFTVITPGEDDRGARRIVGGGQGELYYTDDHYASFFYVVR